MNEFREILKKFGIDYHQQSGYELFDDIYLRLSGEEAVKLLKELYEKADIVWGERKC